MNRPGSPARAFTIIELVIVLTALGLIVGITAPRFIGNSARAQTRSAVRGLVDAITAQRAETIRSMAPSRLFLVSQSSGSGSIRLAIASDGAGEAEATGEALSAMLIQRGRINEPFRLLSVWNGAALETGADEITSGAPWVVRAISVAPTGQISIEGAGPGLALVAPRGGDTIWRIRFDPISGVPSARSD